MSNSFQNTGKSRAKGKNFRAKPEVLSKNVLLVEAVGFLVQKDGKENRWKLVSGFVYSALCKALKSAAQEPPGSDSELLDAKHTASISAMMPCTTCLPHLSHCWKSIWKARRIKWIQRRATKIIKRLEHLLYQERLKELALAWTRLQGDFTALFHFLKGGLQAGGGSTFYKV